MIHSTSVKFRLVFSAGSNILRALITFATGVFIARTLSPSGYGDMMFLIGSFVAIRSLLDLGSSNAFFTFLSQRNRGGRFYLMYFIWMAFQFIVSLAFLWIIIPSSLFNKVWLGHERSIVMLAFIATFIQQQVWQMVGQIGEAMRKTIKVQLLNLVGALLYLIVILIASAYALLTVEKIFYIIIGQYLVGLIIAYHFIMQGQMKLVVEESTLMEIFNDYCKYCHPLILLAFVSFAYDFADKWMLQKFGGSVQQGYFQISSQFAAVSILATSSILNVFWKEIAEAWKREDRNKVAMLNSKVSRVLVMLGAIVSGLLIPWSAEILDTLLGAAYVNAWPIFAIMLLYPIHQSMGQVGGALLLATGQTHKYMFVNIAMMMISVPVSFLLLAPVNNSWFSGFQMGAFGMACKIVILGIVSVNLQALVIAKLCKWQFDWKFQVVGIPLMIALGFTSKIFICNFWDIKNISLVNLIAPFTTFAFVYVILVTITISQMPWLIGFDRLGVVKLLRQLTFR